MRKLISIVTIITMLSASSLSASNPEKENVAKSQKAKALVFFSGALIFANRFRLSGFLIRIYRSFKKDHVPNNTNKPEDSPSEQAPCPKDNTAKSCCCKKDEKNNNPSPLNFGSNGEATIVKTQTSLDSVLEEKAQAHVRQLLKTESTQIQLTLNEQLNKALIAQDKKSILNLAKKITKQNLNSIDKTVLKNLQLFLQRNRSSAGEKILEIIDN